MPFGYQNARTLGPLLLAPLLAWGCDGTQPTSVVARPTEMVISRGDQQTGMAGQPLADSVEVRVLGVGGEGVPGVHVRFTPAAGGGSASDTVRTTDAGGYARTAWLLGETPGEQRLAVRLLDGDLPERSIRASAEWPPHFSVVRVTDAPDAGQSDYGLNRAGEVVGRDGSGAFLWRNGALVRLASPVGSGSAGPVAIADDGTVLVGDMVSSPFVVYSTWLWKDGVYTAVPPSGADRVWDAGFVGTDLNRAGQVSGYSRAYWSWQDGSGFRWQAGGGTVLRPLTWPSDRAYPTQKAPDHNVVQSAVAINGAGDLAVNLRYGNSFVTTATLPALWFGGDYTLVATPGGVEGTVVDLNDRRQVVGWCAAGASCKGFVWTRLRSLRAPSTIPATWWATGISSPGGSWWS
jgi:hypothetical protein